MITTSTYAQLLGNKVVAGRGTFPDVTPVDVQLNAPAQSIVSASVGDEAHIFVVDENNEVYQFVIRDNRLQAP